jgi:hypothetical protein
MARTRKHRRRRLKGKFCVKSAKGKTFGCYASRAQAARIAHRLKGKFHVGAR